MELPCQCGYVRHAYVRLHNQDRWICHGCGKVTDIHHAEDDEPGEEDEDDQRIEIAVAVSCVSLAVLFTLGLVVWRLL